MNNIILHSHVSDPVSGQRFRLLDAGSKAYCDVAGFVQRVFKKAYDADISVTYPQLLSICAQDGTPQAALGLRGAGSSMLFLEHYLNRAVEREVLEKTGILYPRHKIAEAGNLASVKLSALKDMMFALSLALKQEGYDYALFTGTQSLKRYLEALGLRPKVYAAADPGRLGGDAPRWGRYYDTQPMVMGGTAEEFYSALISAYKRTDILNGAGI